ncbi:MAG: WecB/TagA/CpsF family glycosyltransferase [Chloroflexia bacterium]|nr:WecB/TagA/CpsF family glycosyltransferase [Chloroflexia bacterium]
MCDTGAAPRRLDLLGLPLDHRSATEVDTWLESALGEPWDSHCRHLVTLNPEYVIAARADPAFGDVIRAADLVVADGIGIVLAVRLIHKVHVPRITGVELTGRLVDLGAGFGAPAFLLGGGPGVADRAAIRLVQHKPGRHVAGAWDGGTSARADDIESLGRIGKSGARIVLVAYGAAGQVGWIARNQEELARSGVRLAIGVGGAFDFLSGTVPRAPRPIRRLGLEWLYRLVREPWRWRRQLALPRFAALVLITAARRGQPRP